MTFAVSAECERADRNVSKNRAERRDRGLGDWDPSRARQDDLGGAGFFRLVELEAHAVNVAMTER